MRDLGSPFRRFMGAATVSALGDGLMLAGLPLLAREVTDKPLVIASVFAAGRVPWIFGLVVGTVVDRSDARRVLLGADLVRGVLLALLGVLLIVQDRLPNVWELIGLAIVLSMGSIAFFAAAQRVIPSLVEPAHLEDANGLLQSGINTGEQFVGPALGSAFAVNGRIPILGDAASFLASAAILRSLPAIPPTLESRVRLREDIAAGWMQFKRSPAIRNLTIATGWVSFLTAFVLSTEVVIVRDTLHLDGYWFGPFTAILAAGGIVGALVASRVIRTTGEITLPLTALLTAFAYFACVGTRSPFIIFVSLGLQNAIVNIANVSIAAVRHRAVDASRRGAVIALSRSLIYGLQIPGALVGGWIAERFGTDLMFAMAALGSLAIALVTARPLRRLLAPFQAPLPPPKAAA